MKIFIGLISSNHTMNKSYKRLRTALIPRDIITQKRMMDLNPIFIFKAYDPEIDSRSFEDYILSNTRDVDAVILLVEHQHEAITYSVRHAFFMVKIKFDTRNANPKNYFSKILARTLKNFVVLIDTMKRSDNEQVMILPIRNFKSKKLCELAKACVDMGMSTSFNNTIGSLVRKLKEQKQPRRSSNYRTMYIVDENKKYFEYGKERHARLPTGDPHQAFCEINGNFRFGKRIPSDRHFNVTKQAGSLTKISGDFTNCHDTSVSVKETTHLNMFANDSL